MDENELLEAWKSGLAGHELVASMLYHDCSNTVVLNFCNLLMAKHGMDALEDILILVGC